MEFARLSSIRCITLRMVKGLTLILLLGLRPQARRQTWSFRTPHAENRLPMFDLWISTWT